MRHRAFKQVERHGRRAANSDVLVRVPTLRPQWRQSAPSGRLLTGTLESQRHGQSLFVFQPASFVVRVIFQASLRENVPFQQPERQGGGIRQEWVGNNTAFAFFERG